MGATTTATINGDVSASELKHRANGHAKSVDGPVFEPPTSTVEQVRAAIPAQLFERNTIHGLYYVFRDFALFVGFAYAINYADAALKNLRTTLPRDSEYPLEYGVELARVAAWALYWWYQGLVLTGIWVIGHECGHGGITANKTLANMFGMISHSFLLTPFFSWKITHHRHHIYCASMEKDEVWVPWTRSEMGIDEHADDHTFEEYFQDTPIFTLGRLMIQQVLGFQAYFFINAAGNRKHTHKTNHFNPKSALFSANQAPSILFSDIGVLVMLGLLWRGASMYGVWNMVKYYWAPWLIANHWLTTITYLHHTDENLPHYRGDTWNFARGAAATIDRDFLGWQGRFFLHDISHYHVVHHFFPKMPFYNGEEATQYLKGVLGDHYHRSDVPVLKALWNSFNNCQFVEDKGSVLFFRDKKGGSLLRSADEVGEKAEAVAL